VLGARIENLDEGLPRQAATARVPASRPGPGQGHLIHHHCGRIDRTGDTLPCGADAQVIERAAAVAMEAEGQDESGIHRLHRQRGRLRRAGQRIVEERKLIEVHSGRAELHPHHQPHGAPVDHGGQRTGGLAHSSCAGGLDDILHVRARTWLAHKHLRAAAWKREEQQAEVLGRGGGGIDEHAEIIGGARLIGAAGQRAGEIH
jgi:hypothetical protein